MAATMDRALTVNAIVTREKVTHVLTVPHVDSVSTVRNVTSPILADRLVLGSRLVRDSGIGTIVVATTTSAHLAILLHVTHALPHVIVR